VKNRKIDQSQGIRILSGISPNVEGKHVENFPGCWKRGSINQLMHSMGVGKGGRSYEIPN